MNAYIDLIVCITRLKYFTWKYIPWKINIFLLLLNR